MPMKPILCLREMSLRNNLMAGSRSKRKDSNACKSDGKSCSHNVSTTNVVHARGCLSHKLTLPNLCDLSQSIPKNLMQKINHTLSIDQQARYEQLIGKRMAEVLTSNEHDELLCFTEQVEAMNAERIAHLAKLAQLRQTSLTQLMTDLKIGSPDVL